MMIETIARPRFVALLLASALLAGCGGSNSDLENWVAEVKSRKSSAIEPIPQMKQYEAFAYSPKDRRDPFVAVAPKEQQPANNGLRPDTTRNKEPLEEFPLDALRMVGTIGSGGRTYAMIKAPDGVIHRVTIKDHMGQNYGEITQISEAEISLMELVPDGFGGWVQRPSTLALTQ
jgi:type IV pilus assembly protein PilP